MTPTKYCVAHVSAAPETLEFLRGALTSPELYLTTTPRGTAIVLPLEDENSNSTDAWNAAEAALRKLRGALYAYSNLLAPIEVVPPVSSVDERGNGESIGAVMGGRIRIISKEGRARLLETTENGDHTVASRIVRLASTTPEVARVLDLLHESDPSWSDIYLICEIVEFWLRKSGKEKKKDWYAITAEGWLPASSINVLKRNANYHRHASPVSTPGREISLSEAQRHCRDIVRYWLEKLIG